jgi:hypothetical protein
MTNREALKALKSLCDGALKAGIIPTVQDAAALYEMYSLIQNVLSEPNTSNHKQLQPTGNNAPNGRGPEEAGLRELAHY